MKTEIKKQPGSGNYRLIMYPDGLPSTGYIMTKQQLYALYIELRDIFTEDSSNTSDDSDTSEE